MIRGRFPQHLKKMRFRRFFTLPHSRSVFVDPYVAMSDEMGGGWAENGRPKNGRLKLKKNRFLGLPFTVDPTKYRVWKSRRTSL